MEEIILEVQPREETKTSEVSKLRKSGFIPAVVYGQGMKPESIKIPTKDLIRLMHEKHLENTIINLKIENDKRKKPLSVLIKEIQHDPLKGNIVHIDFHHVSLTKAIHVKVPLAAIGEAIGVKQDGGVLNHIMWELEVECLPTQIPHNIEIDISNLKIGDSIHIKDIKLPEGLKVLQDTEAIIFTVAPPEKVEELVPGVETAAATEPEVIKEKKKEEAASGEEAKKEEKPAKGAAAPGAKEEKK
ncbi:MAG: 50S ribosomal protein L25/general stress protein Ctc [Candidatus Omnitrophota bacterium]